MSMSEQQHQLSLRRRADWPEALAAAVEAARHLPYVLGQHDCLRFTCRCIEVMTGADFWPRFAGYSTRLQALRVIAAIAPSLGEAVGNILQTPSQPTAMARRGDVVLYRDASGEHLGVCTGAQFAVLTDQGLAFLPLAEGVHAWRVG